MSEIKNGISILLVGGSALAREQNILENSGYSVIAVPGRKESLSASAALPGPALALVRLGPGGEGIDTARALLAERDMPLIFVLNGGEGEIPEQAKSLPVSGFLDADSRSFLIDASVKAALRLFISKKQAEIQEAALRESEQKYITIIETSPDAIVISNLDGSINFMTKTALTMAGYDCLEDVAGKNVMEFLHPGYREKAANLIGEMFNGNFTGSAEYLMLRKDGSEFYSDANANILCDQHGNPIGIVYIHRDITERKEAEKKIVTLLEEKELILKEVHHRIKNNMNTISSILSLQAGTLKDKAAVMALEDAQSRVQSMAMLYDNLYLASDFIEMSVTQYLPFLIDEIVSNFPNSGSVKVEKEIGDFILSAKQLQPLGIILNELLTNIMKYAFTGRHDGVIRVEAALRENTVEVIIADNGNGMPESVIPEKSTGFGLMLVGGLTRQLRGSMRIERGSGTRVILEFKK